MDQKESINLNLYSHNSSNIEEMKKIWDTYNRIEQPENLSIKLFPHQLVSIYNMEELERVRKITNIDYQNCSYLTDFGILGDIPGYGKSFSVVSLILRDKMSWDVSTSYEKIDINTVNQCLKVVNKQSKKRVKANLLLSSPTLIEQWKEYFSFVKPGVLKIKEISVRKDLVNLNPNDWDVIIISSVRYNELVDLNPFIVWKRFIFDEAASVHINSMRNISAGFTWFVSATYRDLLNCSGTSSHYMRSFFSNFNQRMLANFVIKNPVDFVKHSFKMPEVKEFNHVCLNPRILNVLSRYIDSETRLMIEAGDIKSAILRIGGETTLDTNLFNIVSKRQKDKLLQANLSLTMWKNRQESHPCNPEKKTPYDNEVVFWEKRISDIQNTINELENKYKTLLEDDCTICYSTLTDPILIPCCQNIFCGKCIMKWLDTNKSCPMCRSSVEIKSLVYIKKDKNNNEDEKEEKKDILKNPEKIPKQDKVLEILLNGLKDKRKFLIFSMYDESFHIIRRVLDIHNIDFVEISGSKASRDLKLKKFKENKVSVVFLNSRFNGAGINLETATDIILYHEMPQTVRDQVIGRALRIGRENDLFIHNLVY